MNGKPLSSGWQIAVNRVKTTLLVVFLIVFTIALFGFVGSWFGLLWTGIAAGLICAAVMIPLQLFKAREAILLFFRGVPADPDVSAEKRLISNVEGLSGVAGLRKVPDIYILPSRIPNAFTTGLSEKNAIVCVTQGLLNRLSENELEGVLGHELTHIVHRDILLSQLVAAISAVLMLLTYYAPLAMLASCDDERKSDRRKDDKDKGGAPLLILLFMIVMAPIAKLLSFLVERSVSRKREYSADAGAVTLCGTGEGLACALEKIGSYKPRRGESYEDLGCRLKSLYIHFPTRYSLLSTHPPIQKRVKKLRMMY